MSNEYQDRLQEWISESVGEAWQLPDRPDLEADCVNYVWDKWDIESVYLDEIYLNYLMIQFLSYHCRSAVSSQDITALELEQLYRQQQLIGNDI